MISQGIRTNIAKEPFNFGIFQPRPPVLPFGSAHNIQNNTRAKLAKNVHTYRNRGNLCIYANAPKMVSLTNSVDRDDTPQIVAAHQCRAVLHDTHTLGKSGL